MRAVFIAKTRKERGTRRRQKQQPSYEIRPHLPPPPVLTLTETGDLLRGAGRHSGLKSLISPHPRPPWPPFYVWKVSSTVLGTW